MRQGLASLLLFASFGSFVCAQDAVQGLLAKEWRERNATARTLAAAPTLDVDALLKVMQTPEDEWVVSVGLFGGRGGGRDPITAILLECDREVARRTAPARRNVDAFPLVDPIDLVIPRSAADLAGWLLQRSNTSRDHLRARWRELQIAPTNVPLARLWLRLFSPTENEALAAAARPEARKHVLQVLAAEQPALLHAIARRGAAELQDAALRADAATDFDHVVARNDKELLAVLARRFVQTTDADAASRLGEALLAHRIEGLQAALAAAARDDDAADAATARRRIASFAAVLARTVEIPIAPMQPFVGDENPIVVERALCALRRPARDPQAAKELAPVLFELLGNTRDPRLAAVALHALAGIGPDVPADLAQRARAWAKRTPWRGTMPSVLLALSRLGQDDDVLLANRFRALNEAGTTQQCRDALWEALASQPDAGAKSLLALEPKPADFILSRVAIAAAAVESDRLRDWLAEPRLRLHAISALAAKAPARLPPFRELFDELDKVAKANRLDLLEALVRHPDAGDHAADLVQALLPTTVIDHGPVGDFLRKHHRLLPVATRIDALRGRLSDGVGWWLVADAAPGDVLPLLRACFDECTDQKRSEFARQLVHFGDRDDQDRICAQLATDRAYGPLEALRDAKQLTPALRDAVERHIDTKLRAEHPFGIEDAFAVLWTHRQR